IDSGVPRFDEGGSFAGYIGSCIDITERKLAEEAVADLERRVLSAQDQERERIARELHDDINQRIAILGLELRRMNGRPAGEEPKAHKTFESVADRLSDVAKDIHALSHKLHSTHLEYLGLAPGVEALCSDLREQQQVEIDLVCEGFPRNIPKEIALA